MKSIKTIVLVFLIGLFSSSKVFSVDYSFYVLDSKPAGFNDGSKVAGYYADVLVRIGEELGVSSPQVTLAPYARILGALNDNTSGISMTILFPSPSFGDKVHQPAEVGHFETAVVSMKSNPINWDNINGKRIASIKGASKVYGAKLHDKVESGDIKLGSMANYDQALNMLSAGRIDGFAGNLAPMMSEIRAKGLDISDPAIIANKISRITVSVAPGTPNGDALVAEIGAIVNSMRASGEIQNIIESYLPDAKQPR